MGVGGPRAVASVGGGIDQGLLIHLLRALQTVAEEIRLALALTDIGQTPCALLRNDALHGQAGK